MNIFFLHPNPRRCARWHCNKHVVKMLLESCQLLYTAHWASGSDVTEAPKNKAGQNGYKPTHRHHPCAKWVQQSAENYRWLCRLATELAREYKHRYTKVHACEAHVAWLSTHVPEALAVDVGFTEPPAAMPAEFKVAGSVVASYRRFYVGSKGDKGILEYKGRHVPHWILRSISKA
jgi:hypothetical protein